MIHMYNPYYSFHEIYIPDHIYRQKVKTHMQMSSMKKINISYTQKNLVSSALEVCVPLAALTYITGQRSTVVWARRSVSSWKLRKNSVIGCKVTLRRKKSYIFLEKLYTYGLCTTYIQQKGQTVNACKQCFGISETSFFFELQRSSINWTSFSGFSISIS